MLLNCDAREDSWESLDCKEIKPLNPKGNQPWIVIGRTDAEAEAPIIWPPDGKSQFTGKVPDAGKDWGQEEKWATEDEMVGWHHWLNEHESEQTPGDSGQGSLACCSPWRHKESDTTSWPNSSKEEKERSVRKACLRSQAFSCSLFASGRTQGSKAISAVLRYPTPPFSPLGHPLTSPYYMYLTSHMWIDIQVVRSFIFLCKWCCAKILLHIYLHTCTNLGGGPPHPPWEFLLLCSLLGVSR